jgi:hypothetical protein
LEENVSFILAGRSDVWRRIMKRCENQISKGRKPGQELCSVRQRRNLLRSGNGASVRAKSAGWGTWEITMEAMSKAMQEETKA